MDLDFPENIAGPGQAAVSDNQFSRKCCWNIGTSREVLIRFHQFEKF